MAELCERCMGNIDVATLLLDKFEQQMHGDIQEIEQGLASHDAGQIARTAHALKGAAGALSAKAVQEVAVRIEHAARAGALDRVSTSIADLQSEVDRFLAYLPAARASLAGTNRASTDRAGSHA
jgi:HPt (histidine-containing phosphotransfer) domain-containing protein